MHDFMSVHTSILACYTCQQSKRAWCLILLGMQETFYLFGYSLRFYFCIWIIKQVVIYGVYS